MLERLRQLPPQESLRAERPEENLFSPQAGQEIADWMQKTWGEHLGDAINPKDDQDLFSASRENDRFLSKQMGAEQGHGWADRLSAATAADDVLIGRTLKQMGKAGLLFAIETHLKVPPIRPKHVFFAQMPGSLLMIVKEGNNFRRIFERFENAPGLHVRKYMKGNRGFPQQLGGRLVILDGGDTFLSQNVKHEYTHVLMENYLMPLEQERRLPGYSLPEAQAIFLNMRNELSAYAAGEQFCFDTRDLFPDGKALEEHLKKIPEKMERERFLAEWKALADQMGQLARQGVSPEEALPVFLTAQTIASMNEQLARQYSAAA
ncbi:hypothetical protein HYV73_01140 [Candidatus Uhrbacteria bacterium]|nr:hypothetical protein [Candidatus Uhrbacteria bacterium]